MNENSTTKIQNVNDTKKFGHYDIFEQLGTGGMGSVYRAYDNKLQRQVAIKIPKATLSDKEQQLFLREAQAMANLKHPNIVSFYEINQIQGYTYLAMEYIEGESLGSIIKNSYIPVKKSATIIIEVCKTIEHAHEKGIIHRDLKPENIMIKKDGTPVIMDFGIAKIMNSKEQRKLSRTGMVMGSFMYMSPEQALGRNREIDKRTDVYALGIILYKMLSGNDPFKAKNNVALVYEITNTYPAVLTKVKKHIPKDLANICFKAIAKKKEERYSSTREMAIDLENFMHGKSITASHFGWQKSLAIFIKKHFAKMIIILTFICMIFVILKLTHENQELKLKKQQDTKQQDTKQQDTKQQDTKQQNETLTFDQDLKIILERNKQELKGKNTNEIKQFVQIRIDEFINFYKKKFWNQTIQKYYEICEIIYFYEIKIENINRIHQVFPRILEEIDKVEKIEKIKNWQNAAHYFQFYMKKKPNRDAEFVNIYLYIIQRAKIPEFCDSARRIGIAVINTDKYLSTELKREMQFNLGVICLNQQEYLDAIDNFHAAENNGKKDYWVYHCRFICYKNLNKIAEAKSDAQIILNFSKTTHVADYMLHMCKDILSK